MSDHCTPAVVPVTEHEVVEFRPCAFGDGGFYYHDGADRAICSCGWESAASKNQMALVALFEVHKRSREGR